MSSTYWKTWTMIAALAFSVLGLGVLAQDMSETATVQVMEDEEHGPYLTDGQGITLYLFVDERIEGEGPERMTEGIRDAAVSCTGQCAGVWPPFTAEDRAQAGEGVDDELLYTASFDGRTHVVYNGWPLFFFAADRQPGDLNGQGIAPPDAQSFGAPWYMVSPEGEPIESEAGEVEGASEDAGSGAGDPY